MYWASCAGNCIVSSDAYSVEIPSSAINRLTLDTERNGRRRLARRGVSTSLKVRVDPSRTKNSQHSRTHIYEHVLPVMQVSRRPRKGECVGCTYVEGMIIFATVGGR